MKILIVDDCETNLIFLSTILRKAGYDQLFTSSNKIEVLEIVQDNQINLLIINVSSSFSDAIELTKKVRGAMNTSELLILAISGEDTNLEEALEAGVNDFLRTPLRDVELIARLNLARVGYLEKLQRKAYELQFEEDLQLAKNFQRSVLSPDVVNKDIIMRSYYDPCENVGGDMYFWYKINEHQYAVMIYDVMGHGIASSLVNMSIYSLAKSIIIRLVKPELVMKEFNRQVYFLLQQGNSMDIYFVTGIYLLIDREKNSISYVNAGHPNGFLFYTPSDVALLQPTAPFVGVVRGLPMEEKEVPLKENSHLILYTDGLKDYLQVSFKELEQKFRESLENRKDSFIKTFTQANNLVTNVKKDDICILSLLIK